MSREMNTFLRYETGKSVYMGTRERNCQCLLRSSAEFDETTTISSSSRNEKSFGKRTRRGKTVSWKSPKNYCVWALSQPHKKKTHKEADFSAIFNPLQRVWGPFSMLRDTTFDKLHFHANLFVPQLTPVWCLIFFSYGRFLIYFWVFGAEHRKSWEEFSIFEFEFEFESGDVSEMSKTVEPNGMWKLKLN